MKTKRYTLGIGVDENTALVVSPNSGDVEIIGYRGALVLDLSAASSHPEIKALNLKNAKLTYLDRGDKFNFKTKTVTLHPEKQSGLKVDTNDPS